MSLILNTNNKNTATFLAEEAESDRLSSLPDTLLVSILSLLPTKSAVSTTALSHRWLNLWTQITSLHFDPRDFSCGVSEFYAIVGQLIPKLTSPFIHSFTLVAPQPSSSNEEEVIGSLLRLVCGRNVEKIELTAEEDMSLPLVIPSCVFNTPSLVELYFVGSFDYAFLVDDDAVGNDVSLPNLRNMAFTFCGSQCGFIGKLTKACPLLEELHLFGLTSSWDDNGNTNGYGIVIWGENLRSLSMILPFARETAKIVIDAPKLVSFTLSVRDNLTCSFVKKPSALRDAAICTLTDELFFSLIPMVSRVTALALRPHSLFGGGFKLFEDDQCKRNTPLTFPNLTEVQLNLSAGPFDALASLSFDSEPPSLLRGVKRISIQIPPLRVSEHHLLGLAKYLVAKAPALEVLTVYVVGQSEPQRTRIAACQEMCLFSSICQISQSCFFEFWGQHMHDTNQSFDPNNFDHSVGFCQELEDFFKLIGN